MSKMLTMKPSGKSAPDWETQPRHGGQFGLKGNEPMSKKVTGCRLPQRIEDIISEYFEGKDKSAKSDWLRKIISDAVVRELSHD
jgi:hypothetical protein